MNWVRFVIPLGAAPPDSTVAEGVVNASVDQVWKALTRGNEAALDSLIKKFQVRR